MSDKKKINFEPITFEPLESSKSVISFEPLSFEPEEPTASESDLLGSLGGLLKGDYSQFKDGLPTSISSPLDSAARGGTQGLSAGFADEASGLIGAVGEKAAGLVPGSGLGDKSFADLYREYRDQYRIEDKKAQEANPWTYGVSNLAGNVATGIATGGGASIPGAAAFGAANALGGSEADITKGEYQQAARDTGIGGAIGGVAQGVLPVAMSYAGNKASDAFGTLSNYLSRGAEKLAETATGATGKEAGKFLPNAGRTLLDEGIVKFGSSPDDIAKAAQNRLNEAGEMVATTVQGLDDSAASIMQPYLTKDAVKATLMEQVDKMRLPGGKFTSADATEKLIDDLLANQGDKPFTLTDINKWKQSLGDSFKNPAPEVRTAGKAVYQGLRENVLKGAGAVDDKFKNIIEDENRMYQTLKPIQKAAENRANTNNQAQWGNLKDIGSAIATQGIGGGIGATLGSAFGPVGIAIGAGAGVLASRAITPRLPAAGAVSLDFVSKTLQSSPEFFGKYAAPLMEASKRGGTSLAVTDYILSQQHPEYREMKDQEKMNSQDFKDITIRGRNER